MTGSAAEPQQTSLQRSSDEIVNEPANGKPNRANDYTTSLGDDNDDDDENSFDVECIVAEKQNWESGKTLYLVHWKGFQEKDYTWEPKEHFHAPDTLLDWELFKKNTPASDRFNWQIWDRKFGSDSGRQYWRSNRPDPVKGPSVQGQLHHNEANTSFPPASNSTALCPGHSKPVSGSPNPPMASLGNHLPQAGEKKCRANHIAVEGEFKQQSKRHYSGTEIAASNPHTIALRTEEALGGPNLGPNDTTMEHRQSQPGRRTRTLSNRLPTVCRAKNGTNTIGQIVQTPASESTEKGPQRRATGQDLITIPAPQSKKTTAPASDTGKQKTLNSYIQPLLDKVSCTIYVDQEDLQIRNRCMLTGLGPGFCNHLKKLGDPEFVVGGFVGFEYLKKIFIEESGLPTERGTVEAGGELGGAFVARLSELQGAALILESTFTMILAPSHAHKFHHIFDLPSSPSYPLSLVVYPPLDVRNKIAWNLKPQKEQAFPGNFILEGGDWNYHTQNQELVGHQAANIVLLPSARTSKYCLDVACSFESCRRKAPFTQNSGSQDKLLVPPHDIFSQRSAGNTNTGSSVYIFLLHTSIMRNLHLVPNLALLRSHPSRSFFVFGPELDLGSHSLTWNIRQIYRSGGVLLLTFELVLKEAAKVLEILNILSSPNLMKLWALAIPDNMTSLLENALTMGVVHERLARDRINRCLDLLHHLKTLAAAHKSSLVTLHILYVSPNTDVNYTENCVDTFVRFQAEASKAYRLFAVICGPGLTDKRTLERQYTNLDLYEIERFLELLQPG